MLDEIHRLSGGSERQRRLCSFVPTWQLAAFLHATRLQTLNQDQWRRMFDRGRELWQLLVASCVLAGMEAVALLIMTFVQGERTFFPGGRFTPEPLAWIARLFVWGWEQATRLRPARDGALVWLGQAGQWMARTVGELIENLKSNEVLGIDARWLVGILTSIAVLWLAAKVVLPIVRWAAGVVESLLNGLLRMTWLATVILVIALLLVLPSIMLHRVVGSWWLVALVWLLALAAPVVAAAAFILLEEREANPIQEALAQAGVVERRVPALSGQPQMRKLPASVET